VPDWRNSETRARLSLAERGLFRELLDQCHMEGSIPDDPKVLARICGCTLKEFNRTFHNIRDQFVQDGDRLLNPKAAEVRVRLLGFHEARKTAGTAGAKKRWGKIDELPSSIPGGSGEHPASVPGQNPEEAAARQTTRVDSANASRPAMASLNLSDSLPQPQPQPQHPQPPKPPSSDGLFFHDESTSGRQWEDEVATIAKAIYARHPSRRRCSLKTIQGKVRSIAKSVPLSERLGLLRFIDSQHEKWCNSGDWHKDGGDYVKSLDAWLNPEKRLWENEPRRPSAEESSPIRPNGSIYTEYREAEE
jgi:hypothetical protein